MWPTLLLVTSSGLFLGQAGNLTLTNERWTFGPLGAVRPDNKFLPGEILYLSFDIEGLKTGEGGQIAYSTALEVIDAKGMRLVRQEPRNMQAVNFLGGTKMTTVTQLQISLSQGPGAYTLKTTITDRTTQATRTLDRPFEVLPAAFGLVHVGTSLDLDGAVPSPAGLVGQTLYVNFAAVGFGRDTQKKLPNMVVEMHILDENGQPTSNKPMTGAANKDIPEKLQVLPMQFGLTLNRPGKFTIELKATDQITQKTVQVSFPFLVAAIKQ